VAAARAVSRAVNDARKILSCIVIIVTIVTFVTQGGVGVRTHGHM
jgi:hypothetical protein